ncbi:MAG: hypothetical protein IT303_06715 [Dehalococcoidia bacterium]|nr:hypothetical protein [Dehalococcoidia bacterium]
MERVRFKSVAFAAALGALALAAVVAQDAGAKSGLRDNLTAEKLPYNQVLPALLPNSKENTSVIAQNNGTAAATIAMDIYTPQGVLVPSASKVETNVPPGGTRTFAQAINTGLTPGFRGVGVLSSDQPINALLVRDIEQAGTGRKSYSIHNAYPTGGSVVTLPYISNNLDNTYNTRFAIANTGSATACVTIAYAYVGGGGTTDAGTGGSGCATGHPIPVGGQIAFGPQTVTAEATQAMPAATAGRLMAATVTSTGAPVTVGVDAYLTSGPRKLGSYDGFIVDTGSPASDDLGTTISIPLALKLDGYYSQVLMSNPNGTAANATITYRSQGGQTYTVNRTIPANGTANHSVYEADGGIPEGFIGAATITSDQPIAAVLFRAKMTAPGSYIDEDLYTAVNGVPTDRATTTAKLPLIFRRAYGNNATCEAQGALCGYNSWVSITVPGGGTANVTLTTINDPTSAAPGCSGAATYTTTFAVTGSFVFYQNANSNNGLGANPACLWGGMTVTSDVPVIAIADVTTDLQPGDNDGLYNAFGS